MGRNLDAAAVEESCASHPIRRFVGQVLESGDIVTVTWGELNIFGF